MSGTLRPYAPEHAEAVILAESYSFGVAAETVPKWLERAGHENVRSFFSGDRLVGALLVVPMGIFFGGRSVKNLGIAGVAIGPFDRGRGHAYEMMAEAMREGRRAGYAVSTLYPATISLYRKAGFELAGGHYEITLDLRRLNIRANDGELVPITRADLPELTRLQRAQAMENDGNLDRGPYIWERVFAPRLEPATGVGVRFGGQLEGYLVLKSKPSSDPPFHDLHLTDLLASTPRAAQRILSFLCEHRSLGLTAHWTGGQYDPLLSLLPEKIYTHQLYEQWMLRILDVRAALEARGYRNELPRSLELEIEDRVIPENTGTYRLESEGGQGRVTASTGGPKLRTTIRGLAALYSGYAPASALARLGVLEGEPAAIEAADRIFLGRTPWMQEMF